MTIATIATQLLTHFSPEERSVPDSVTYPGRNGWVLSAMNGALQELYTGASPWVRKDERGALLHAPATAVSIDVTNGSTTATISAGTWQAWFSGCAIAIEGAGVVNQIRNDARNVVLKFPHDGTTGTKTATVYQTSVDVAADMIEVTGGVKVNRAAISPVTDPPTRDDGSALGVICGTPICYSVDAWSPGPTASPRTRINLWPAADANGFLEYRGKVVPVVITSLATTDTLPVPLQFIESIFLPVATQRLTACPFFLDAGRADEIARAYKQAKLDLANLNPSRDSGMRMYSRY